MDSGERIKLTRDMIKNIRLPEAPPPNFDPLSADEKTLIKHGLPLQPNKTSEPEQYVKWKSLVTQARTFIPTKFDIIEREDMHPSGEAVQEVEKKDSPRWAGAVVINEDAKNNPYKSVEGSWIVPRAFPLTEDWEEWGWKNKAYRSGTWVGIDGYHTHGNSHVLQGGTAEKCIVTPRQAILHPTHAWVEWVPAGPIELLDFEVNSGDLITCIVESPDPSPPKSVPANQSARIMMFNRSTCNYSTAHMTMPADGLPVKGETAEWIVEGPNPHYKDKHASKIEPWSEHKWYTKWYTPYLGAAFIYDCLAVSKKGKRIDLEKAREIDQVQNGKRLNRAEKQNSGMVGIFSEVTYPNWTEIVEVKA